MWKVWFWFFNQEITQKSNVNEIDCCNLYLDAWPTFKMGNKMFFLVSKKIECFQMELAFHLGSKH
jgi:hypothetical protein